MPTSKINLQAWGMLQLPALTHLVPGDNQADTFLSLDQSNGLVLWHHRSRSVDTCKLLLPFTLFTYTELYGTGVIDAEKELFEMVPASDYFVSRRKIRKGGKEDKSLN
ncbi:hypothetical protein RRG08_030884 [Elysia crispata]|uniref:Uncharacterized protein n=1 Tax=Elysia crispata TaxID=231223 RepID=A0AAE0XU57_9GAST|nr:hypothetical protein RRG08_030884 [Elysia crispata]